MLPRQLFGALLVIGLCACQSKKAEPQASAPASSGSSVAPSSSAGPVSSSHGLKPDPAFLAELNRVAGTCTYLEKRDALSCASAQIDPLDAKIEELGPVALEALLATVYDGVPRVAALAGTRMRSVYERSLPPTLEKAPVPERLVTASIDALDRLPVMQALRVAPAATFVVTREGRLDALVPIVERRPELRGMILPRVMRYPRLRALPQVQKWTASADEDLAVNALEALHLMQAWTDAERKELEAWLAGFLTHQSIKLQGRAAGFLLNCSDKAANDALRWFEAALPGKRLTRDTVFAFGRRCRPDNDGEIGAEERAQLAVGPLCLKIEKLMDRVAADAKIENEVRAAALEMLTAAWPKTALRRAQVLIKDPNPWLAEQAATAIRLTDGKKK